MAEFLAPEHFTFYYFGQVYLEILKQWQSGVNVDAGTVSSALPENICHIPIECEGGVGTAENAVFYARKISDAAKRREIVAICHSISNMAKADEREVSDIIGDAQTRMHSVEHRQHTVSIMDEMHEIGKESEEAAKRDNKVIGVATHFDTIDQVTGGLRNGHSIVVAARPSVGKTALITNICQNIVRHGTEKAAFFSAEQSRREILLRMISGECLIENKMLESGRLRKDEWDVYYRARNALGESMENRLWIYDKSGMTPHYIRSVAKQRQQSDGLDIIFIDYMQLLKMPGRFSGTPERLTEISHSLKDMAKDLRVPVVVAAQVGRGAEDGAGMRRPGLSDLKGSGTIEEDADVVILLHREERTSIDAEAIIAKHRNGPLGDIKMIYNGATTTFKEK